MIEVRTSYLELLAGRIEDVDGECVATHFFAPFALPLFPQRSIHLSSEVREARRQMAHQGQPIPLVWKSVILGYLRIWLAWLAFTSPFWLMWGEPLDFSRSEWFVSLGLFLAWILTLVVPGRLSKRERAARQVLRGATGTSIDPKRLGPFDREEHLEMLGEALGRAGLTARTPDALEAAAAGAAEPLARRIFAYARYAEAHDRDASWRNVADAAWRRFGWA